MNSAKILAFVAFFEAISVSGGFFKTFCQNNLKTLKFLKNKIEGAPILKLAMVKS